jgi:hypothetical protein
MQLVVVMADRKAVSAAIFFLLQFLSPTSSYTFFRISSGVLRAHWGLASMKQLQRHIDAKPHVCSV